jgi:O-antigen/teichoic acid export membrane protein
MKLNNKEFFKLSFLYTAVAAFPPFLQLIIRPLIEGDNKLNPADFSQIEIAETITSLAFIIALYSMGNAISRFYYDYTDNQKGYNKLVSSVMNSILIRGFLFLGMAFLFRNQIGALFSQPELQDFSKYGFAAIIIGINRAINITAFTLYRNEKKVRKYLIFSFLLGIFRAAFQLIGVFYYDMSFVGYLYGSCIGSGLVAISILIYTYSQSGFHLDRKIMKPVNQFAAPLFQYYLVYWGISFADRYFLESTPVMLGIYSQALILGKGIEVVLQGLQGASQPEMFRMLKEGVETNLGEIKKLSNLLMAQSQLVIALAIIPAMIYCMVFKTDLRLAAGLIAIVFIRYILRTQYIIFSFPVYYEKKTRFFFYLNIGVLIINLGLLYFLIPLIGLYGAIAAIIVSQIVQVLGIYLYQKSIINISWNLNKLLIFPLFIVGVTVALEFLKVKLGWNEYLTAGLVILSMIASLSFLYRNEIRNIFSKGWKQFS